MEIKELGPYELTDVLGKGGMGTVYRGVAKATGQEVAVKVLAPFYASHDAFRRRFEAEIESLKKLRHPRIVTLYGHGEESGLLFYVMELIRGNSLQDELTQGRQFHWREVCQIGADICAALKQAHDHGIIHRDIKPANLLLDESGRAKLSDFGIAKYFEDTKLTMGGVLGTVDYMAPEQAEGLPPTPRCDIYCMGAVMYTLLAGQAPFRGKTSAEVLQKLRYDEPVPVGRLNPDTPSELENIISQLLEKEPADRIPTALALAKRLQALYETPTDQLVDYQSSAGDVTFATPSDVHDDKLAKMQTIAAEEVEVTPEQLANQESSAAEDVRQKTAPSSDGSAVSTYETVDRDRPFVEEESESRPESTLRALLTWTALLASLGAVVFFIAQALRPPSADHLFQQITTALESGDTNQLQKQSDAAASFLARFPDDDRAESIRQISGQIANLERMKKLRARLRRGDRDLGSQSLIENRLLEAWQLEATQPREAMARYQAILDLFDANEDVDQSSSENTRTDQLQLARQRLQELSETQTALADKYRDQLNQQLSRADQLAAEDLDAARLMWHSVIRLYAEDVWAEDLVQQARQRLDETTD